MIQLNAKITEVENKIPSITDLGTNSALTAVENKISDAGSSKDIEKKITDHDREKYITTPEFDTLAARGFTVRLRQADLVTKTEYDTKLQDINKRITSNKTMYLLVENEFQKLQKVDMANFRGRNPFAGDDGVQNYLVFQPAHKQLKMANNKIFLWESKALPDEKSNYLA